MVFPTCCFPGCDGRTEDGAAIPTKAGARICAQHRAEAYELVPAIAVQSRVVQAAAAALQATLALVHATRSERDFGEEADALKTEYDRLRRMQARHVLFLQLAGFDRVDEGVE